MNRIEDQLLYYYNIMFYALYVMLLLVFLYMLIYIDINNSLTQLQIYIDLNTEFWMFVFSVSLPLFFGILIEKIIREKEGLRFYDYKSNIDMSRSPKKIKMLYDKQVLNIISRRTMYIPFYEEGNFSYPLISQYDINEIINDINELNKNVLLDLTVYNAKTNIIIHNKLKKAAIQKVLKLPISNKKVISISDFLEKNEKQKSNPFEEFDTNTNLELDEKCKSYIDAIGNEIVDSHIDNIRKYHTDKKVEESGLLLYEDYKKKYYPNIHYYKLMPDMDIFKFYTVKDEKIYVSCPVDIILVKEITKYININEAVTNSKYF